MTDRRARLRAGLIPLLGMGLIVSGLVAWVARPDAQSRPAAGDAARAFDPAAPILPAEVVAALQEKTAWSPPTPSGRRRSPGTRSTGRSNRLMN